MLKAILSKKDLTGVPEYYNLVKDLLSSDYVRRLKDFNHHFNITRFQHSLNVSYYNFKICRFLRLDVRAAARAGLLHDLYFYDNGSMLNFRFNYFNGTHHPSVALYNSSKLGVLTPKEADMILYHMFPFTLKPPKTLEGWIITLTDKGCAVAETILSAGISLNPLKHRAITEENNK